MGARLAIEQIEANWGKTYLIIQNKLKVGYVPISHVVYINHQVNDWVKMAEKLEGTL